MLSEHDYATDDLKQRYYYESGINRLALVEEYTSGSQTG